MGNYLLIKKIDFDKSGRYPDLGSCVEVFTDNNMLEIETLSPLQTITQGEAVIHQEEWQLWKTSDMPTNDQGISASIKGIV